MCLVWTLFDMTYLYCKCNKTLLHGLGVFTLCKTMKCSTEICFHRDGKRTHLWGVISFKLVFHYRVSCKNLCHSNEGNISNTMKLSNVMKLNGVFDDKMVKYWRTWLDFWNICCLIFLIKFVSMHGLNIIFFCISLRSFW